MIGKKEIISIITGMIMLAMVCFPAGQVSADTLTAEEVIQSYYNNVNTQNIDCIIDVLDGEYRQIAQNVYRNKENIANHVGIFNISNAEVVSINEISSFEGLEALELSDFEGEAIKVFKVCVNLTKYQDEEDGYCDGTNELYFIFNSNNKIIGVRMMRKLPEIKTNDDNISPLGYDTPIAKPLVNPDMIRVYIVSTGAIERVWFKTYCKVVAVNEVGNSSWDIAAVRACALAIKDYGIARLYGRKYQEVGYDIMDSEDDQVYNPDKARTTKCDNAVNYIWDYYVVDASSRLFPTFHVSNVDTSSRIKKHAKKHMGVMSQKEANALATSKDYSWKKILKYFYTRESEKSYYNNEVAVGSVSIVK